MKRRDFNSSLKKIESFLRTNGLTATCKMCEDCLVVIVEKKDFHYYLNRKRIYSYLHRIGELLERKVVLVKKL